MTGVRTLLIIVGIVVAIIVISTITLVIFRHEGSAEPALGTLLKSADGGLTWKVLDKFPGGQVTTLDFDSSNGNKLIVGTSGRGVWSGDVSGENWKQFPGGVGETSRIFDILDPITEEEFIALVLFANRGRILRFEDGFRSELFFTPLERFAFLSGYKTSSGFLRVIGSDGGFYESRNNGLTWRSVSRFHGGLSDMTFDPIRNDEIWVTDAKGNFYKSVDGGINWSDLTNGLRSFDGAFEVGFIFFDNGSGILYHGSKHGLLRSFDGGNNWTRVELTVPPESLPTTAMAVEPNNSMRLFVAAENQIYISEDGGISWKGIAVSASGRISNILINPRNVREIFVGFGNI